MFKFLALLLIASPALADNATYIKGPALIESTSTTATAAGNTTLTASSNTNQEFTGTTTQTVTLPNATTLANGRRFKIWNRSTGALTLKNNGASTLTTIAAGADLDIILISNTSSNGTWSYKTSSVTSVADGGTGLSTLTANNVILGNGASNVQFVAPSTSGNVLQSNGTTWISAAPSAASYTAPTIQRFTSSSGTYTTPTSPAPIYIKVKMVGGGGSGGSDSGGSPTAGGNTTFGSSLLTANGGTAGAAGNGDAGTGGTCTVNSPAVTVVSLQGGPGSVGTSYSAGVGGTTPFGRATSGGGNSYGPKSPVANTGGGGNGGSTNAAGGGAGGGAGCYIEAIISSPSSTYSYAVGAGGTNSDSSTGGGGDGSSGVIIVEEYYQ